MRARRSEMKVATGKIKLATPKTAMGSALEQLAGKSQILHDKLWQFLDRL